MRHIKAQHLLISALRDTHLCSKYVRYIPTKYLDELFDRVKEKLNRFKKNIEPVIREEDEHCLLQEDETSTCAICLDEIFEERKLLISCGHEYHDKCINDWSKEKRICPLCRGEIV